jgi:hypothetical protein
VRARGRPGRGDEPAGHHSRRALLAGRRRDAITNTDFSARYQETLIVDARSGVIEKMTGGTAGQTPDVTVRYDVRRVTAAEVLR